MIRLGRAITTTEVCSLSRSLRGRVGMGVPPQNALVERIDFPPSAALRRAIARWSAVAETQLRRSIYFRTAADAPPQAGEVKRTRADQVKTHRASDRQTTWHG